MWLAMKCIYLMYTDYVAVRYTKVLIVLRIQKHSYLGMFSMEIVYITSNFVFVCV
jgi:hypothetical protein